MSSRVCDFRTGMVINSDAARGSTAATAPYIDHGTGIISPDCRQLPYAIRFMLLSAWMRQARRAPNKLEAELRSELPRAFRRTGDRQGVVGLRQM